MIKWQYYPKSHKIEPHLKNLIGIFEKHNDSISSAKNTHNSDKVLSFLRKDLVDIGYAVEGSKKAADKVRVPVLFGRNGKPEKSFDADAFNENTYTVLEVEAGRGVTNYQFLKDLFQACMMHNVDYLSIAVRDIYRGNNDFDAVVTFFDTLFASARLELPLKGILIIGY